MATPTLRHFTDAVSEVFQVPVKALRGPQRAKRYVRARAALVKALYDTRKRSYPEIGQYLGGRDHTTVMHSYRKAEILLKWDSDFRAAFEHALHRASVLAQRQPEPPEDELRRKINQACNAMIAQVEGVRRDLLKTLE